MEYTKFVRPNGKQEPASVTLDERSERLAKACIDHLRGNRFTYEDCGAFINMCFEAWVDEPDTDDTVPVDVVCELVSLEAEKDKQRMRDAWSMTVAKAADYLQIHIP